MPSTKDRFTATLSQLRPAEITKDRPGRIELRVATSGRHRDVVLDGQRVTIGAHSEDENLIRQSFETTYKIYEALKPHGAEICSMGMSHDFELAIECGSNMVRIGSLLFKD